MKLYVTYGFGSNLKNCYSVVEGEDILVCYKTINSVCGQAHAHIYAEKRFAGKVEHCNLTEVPLQAQIKEFTL